ncbi:2-keto-4-pentenoate hydratase [Lentibacillus amyloliquefaciens]|uniref:2-keto-4-pentenoate hydratase n=1 Tax=Lentibacillus amyloliquefaciens TaxID=1472767 RepID=A0A0U3WHI2_9BACI|nr:fumarylacetoacetate hydrolase family protein [Lentibacillus amyloliquefaciens]ALX49327.1 2-keto-4-pentenoate hydratase [Lentibacillus amyloliquefaciens]
MTGTNNEIVQTLKKAYETKEPIDFIRKHYNLDEQAAYKIQNQFVTEKCERTNETIAGFKISMTSPDTQAYANTDEPAYGTFIEGNLIHSNESVLLNSLFDPLVEPELVFVLTGDLTAGASEEEIISKSKIAAGLEIPDSRYKDWFPNFTLEDLLCDNGAAGLAVISNTVETPSFEQLDSINMELFHNGEKIGEGSSSNVLENPASAVAWLSKKMSGHGKTLKKGMIISSGTFIPPLRVEEGTYHAVYTGIGEVSVTFNR